MEYLVKHRSFSSFEEAEEYRSAINYPFIHCGEGEWLDVAKERNHLKDDEIVHHHSVLGT